MDVRESEAKRLAGITNVDGVQISRCLSAARKKAIGSWMIADFQYPNAGNPHWNPAVQHLLNARTSQDCGSSTAQSPEKSRLLRGSRFCCMMRRFVDNSR
jgi:hypothetical protein